MDPVLGSLSETKNEKTYFDIVGAKIVLRKGACNSELNFAPKAQFFLSLDWKVPS